MLHFPVNLVSTSDEPNSALLSPGVSSTSLIFNGSCYKNPDLAHEIKLLSNELRS